MRLAKAFLYHLFPYKYIAAGLKKLNPPRSHYNVLAAGPGGISMPLHICASVSNRNGNAQLLGSNFAEKAERKLTDEEIIKEAGIVVKASVQRATLYWDKWIFDRYTLFKAETLIKVGSLDPNKYELPFTNLKPGMDYRLVLSDSHNRKSPISISFKTRDFLREARVREPEEKTPVEGIERALQEAAESAARIKDANDAIQRVLKQRYFFKSNKIVDAALAALQVDGLTQKEAQTVISELLDDFYPSQPKIRKAVIEQIKKRSGTFNLNGLE